MSQSIVRIPLDQFVESPFNPRKVYDEDKLDELAASMKQGQQVPVKARKKDGKYEIVFGHRRLRAGRKAKLDGLDTLVVDMSDEEALEAQIVENGQRADVTPLEEADSYRLLQTKFNKGVDEIAKTIGKSTSHVYARMKLSALKDAGRKALMAGKILPETALLIARVPTEKQQANALKDIVGATYRDAADIVQRNYMLQLSDAPFSKTRDDILTKEQYVTLGGDEGPTGPSCKECRYRTGNMPAELRADVKGADICTQPDCFRAKLAVYAEDAFAAAKEKGLAVLSQAKAKEVFGGGRDVDPQSGWVDVERPYPNDPKKRSLNDILGKDLPPPSLVRDPDGYVRAVADEEDVKKALKAIGYGKPSASEQKANDEDKEAARKEREARALRRATAVALLESTAENAPRMKMVPFLRLVAREMPWGIVSEVAKMYDTTFEGWKKLVESANEETLLGMVAQCVLQGYIPSYIRGEETKGLKEVLAALGLDLRESEKATKADLKAEAEEEAAAKEAEKQPKAKAKGPLARKQRAAARKES